MREGASIGPYRVLRKIGEGGMGTVFLGEHTLIGRHAAIKVLLPELSVKRESVDRFFNEARATTAISDPGIVQVFDFGFTAENVAYIVMELLEGEQLNLRLQRLGALAPSDALRITRQVAGSLGAAHAAGIVHRDLKPENLYMIRDAEAPGGERPKILDFGIAKLGDVVPDRLRTRTGAVLGTPVYMSPEQCNGAARIDHRADIYSLGCVLFHLVTGRPPFDVPGVGAVISAHLREPAPAPSAIVPQLPAELDELMRRCLAKPPDHRFASMLELQKACDAILAHVPLGGAPTLTLRSASTPMLVLPPTLDDGPLTLPESPSSIGGAGGAGGLPGGIHRPHRGGAGGPPSAVLHRRRIALWVVLGVLAGGAGSAIAVVTARSSEPPAASEPRSAAAAAAGPEVPARTEGTGAGAAPVVPAPAPMPSGIPPDAASPEIAGDAGAAPGVAEPAIRPRPIPPLPPRKTTVGKPAVKTRPARPRSQDLYDDRN